MLGSVALTDARLCLVGPETIGRIESDDDGGVDRDVDDRRGLKSGFDRVAGEKNLVKWSILEVEDAVVDTDEVRGSGRNWGNGEGLCVREEDIGSGDCALENFDKS